MLWKGSGFYELPVRFIPGPWSGGGGGGQAWVTAALSLGVGHNGEIWSYLISVNIGTYCELLSGWHQSGFSIRRELVKGDFWAIFYIKSIEVLILNLDSRIIQLQTWALNPKQINELSRASAACRLALMVRNARSTWQWTFQLLVPWAALWPVTIIALGLEEASPVPDHRVESLTQALQGRNYKSRKRDWQTDKHHQKQFCPFKNLFLNIWKIKLTLTCSQKLWLFLHNPSWYFHWEFIYEHSFYK